MSPRPHGARGFDKPLVLPGWSPTSRWGYDAGLECFWAEAHRTAGGTVRVGPEHLLVTLDSLVRTTAAALGLDAQEVYLALTCAQPVEATPGEPAPDARRAA